MEPSEAFHTIDDTKGTLTYMLVLAEPETQRMERLELIETMRANGINRDKFYKITKALAGSGLIEEVATQPNGRVKRVKTELTPKGRQVAELLQKIKQTLT
jgi:predicted transcriptional regulator